VNIKIISRVLTPKQLLSIRLCGVNTTETFETDCSKSVFSYCGEIIYFVLFYTLTIEN